MQATDSTSKLCPRIVSAHVYIGGANSGNLNRQAFGDAVTNFNSLHSTLIFVPIYMNCKQAKLRFTTFEGLIDWLHDCDAHFILTHLHQGAATCGGVGQMGWEVDKLYAYLEKKLFYHPGFPTGKQLRCPIFTQDKYMYLKPLMGSMPFVNNTLKVVLREDENYDSIMGELQR